MTYTYAQAAERLGRSARLVSREARALGIPRPLTSDDVDRLGYRLYGPHGGMPRFTQQPDGHFKKEAR